MLVSAINKNYLPQVCAKQNVDNNKSKVNSQSFKRRYDPNNPVDVIGAWVVGVILLCAFIKWLRNR